MEFIIKVSQFSCFFLLWFGALFLHSCEVLIELVLYKKVVSDTFVEGVNLNIFGLKFVIFTFIQLDCLLKSKLKEGDIITSLLIACKTRLSILIGYI